MTDAIQFPGAQTDAPAPGTPAAEAEVATTTAQIVEGPEYKESFTMRQAVAAWNATRKPVVGPDGAVIVPAEKMHVSMPDAWFTKREGTFKLRRPTFYDSIKIRSRVAAMTDGAPVDEWTESAAEGAAVCEVLLVEKPDWFDVAKLETTDEVLFILNWYKHWSLAFRSQD